MSMQRICDDCKNSIEGAIRVQIVVVMVHLTNKQEEVGEDEYQPIDLCGPCSYKPRTVEQLTALARRYPRRSPIEEDVPMNARAIAP